MPTETMISARDFRSMTENANEKDSARLVRKVSDDGAHAVATAPEFAGEDG
jgi:hypothetical protein